MTDDESKKIEEHVASLGLVSAVISQELWERLNAHLQKLEQIQSPADVSYIVTTVVANIFAHYNAVTHVYGGMAIEHVAKIMPELFEQHYQFALPALIKQFEEDKRKETPGG